MNDCVISRRRGLGSSTASVDTMGAPKIIHEDVPSYGYVIPSESATPTPDTTTIQHTKSREKTAPTDAAAAASAPAAPAEAVVDTRKEAATTTARYLSPKQTAAGSVTGTGGGEFGLSADWRYALSMPRRDGKGDSLKDEACLVDEKQENVNEILRRRKTTPAGSKVWECTNV